jgi:acyl CoA:acetate/3-ketoacid CoA transferase alpha subunit
MSHSATGRVGVIASGDAPYLPVDPDGFRDYVRAHKQRALTPRLMSEADAVRRFVPDGGYLVYECNYIMRGPNSLVREIIRQGKRELWLAGKFSYPDVGLLVGAGCANKVDCGFFLPSRTIARALDERRLEIYEYSNVVMTQRLLAGSMGVPFVPVRSFGGTSGFARSGCKVIEDPFTGEPLVVAPALNPDVAIIHVNQADVYGNARIFGTGISHTETALASKRVILSTEEVVSTDVIRSNPGLTTIPFYAVDAVVHAPFGAYPGTCPGAYASDSPAVFEAIAATAQDSVAAYARKWVHDFADDRQMLTALVPEDRQRALRERETITEGYRP